MHLKNKQTKNNENTEEELVFPLHHFDKLKDFKSTLFSLKEEIKSLIGDTRVMFAIKKHGSIGNMMVQNKHLSMKTNTATNGQKCNSAGCKQCPLVNPEDRFVINGTSLKIPRHLNCKSKNHFFFCVFVVVVCVVVCVVVSCRFVGDFCFDFL